MENPNASLYANIDRAVKFKPPVGATEKPAAQPSLSSTVEQIKRLRVPHAEPPRALNVPINPLVH